MPTRGTFFSTPFAVNLICHSTSFELTHVSYLLQRTWANEQARRTYPNFVAELDRLKADDVVWEPYSPQAVATRAPYGLSSWCTSNSGLWLTKTCLVYDIYVEAHCPDRVMRQFGYQQPFPVPRALDRISRGDHRYFTIHKILDLKSKVFHSVTEHVIFQCRLSRLGQPCSSTWVQKLKPYVDAWDEADEDVFEPIGDHTDEWYQHFLTWYQARTRIRVTYAETQQVAHEATSTDTYARHRDEALAGAVSQYFNFLFQYTTLPNIPQTLCFQMQICCQLQSHAHSALTRVQGGNPFSMTEQLEGLTRANEGFLSMMQAWGVSPRMEVAPVQQPPAPPQQTGNSNFCITYSKRTCIVSCLILCLCYSALMAIPIDGRSIHVVHADGSSTNVVPTYGYSIFAADGSSCVHADLSTGNRFY